MAFTLPGDAGGYVAYDEVDGNRIMDTRGGTVYIWGSVDILENVHIGGIVSIDGTVHLHGDPSLLIDGDVEIGGTVEISGDTDVTGDLHVTGGFTVTAGGVDVLTVGPGGLAMIGRFESGSGGFYIDDDVMGIGDATLTFAPGGLINVSDDLAVGGSLQVSSTFEVTGTATFNGAFDHNGSTFGVLGHTPRVVWGVAAAATDLPSVIALANDLRSAGLGFGFLTP